MSDAVRRITRNALWLAAGEGAVKGAVFLAAVIVARAAGPEGMGVFSIAFAAAVLAVMVLASGQQEVLIREVAAAPDRAGDLLTASRRVQNGFGRWILPVCLLGPFLIADPDLRLTLLTFVPYAFLRTLLVTHGAAFKGLDRMDMEVRARVIEVVVVLGALAAVGTLGLPIWWTGIVFSAGSAGALAWLVPRSRTLGCTTPDPPDGETLRTAFRREGLPFLALAVGSQLLSRVDTFLLAALDVSHTDIGFYGAAGAPIWGIASVPTLLAVAFYPTLARRAARQGSLSGPIGAAVLGGGLLGAGITAALILFREPLVGAVFGDAYGPSVDLLGRLAWALPSKFVMTFLGLIAAAWRRQHLALIAVAAVLVLEVALNLLWIPTAGALGAANAAVAAHAGGVVVLLALVPWMRPARTENPHVD